jgi:putative oxidoreductase
MRPIKNPSPAPNAILDLVVRSTTGILFASAGFDVLFPADNPAMLLDVLRYATALHPGYAPVLLDLLIAAIKLAFGLLLTAGCLTRVSALLLLACVLHAEFDAALHAPSNSSPIDWLAEMLVQPTSLDVLLLVWFALSGPSALSFDRAACSTSGQAIH